MDSSNSSSVKVCFDVDVSQAKLSKWKVKAGSRISAGTVLLLYDDGTTSGTGVITTKKWKAALDGTVTELLATEGDMLHNGCVLMSLMGCLHPVIMKDMCADCGADLRESKEERKDSFASISMVHSVPELRVSKEQAQLLGKADEQRLLQSRKLVLLVDLDQTLIHTTNDDVPPNLKDVHHFQLYGAHSPWYHARLRPGTKEFLEKVGRLFELHICTFGARLYAHTVANILDADGRFFSHRILSRDECFSANSKKANLKALFPCGDNMVAIIDDREDVWNFAPNVVHVKPYHFFQHTGDINAPPGMNKTEFDGQNNEKGNVGSDPGGRYLLGKRIKRVVKLTAVSSTLPTNKPLESVTSNSAENKCTEKSIPESIESKSNVVSNEDNKGSDNCVDKSSTEPAEEEKCSEKLAISSTEVKDENPSTEDKSSIVGESTEDKSVEMSVVQMSNDAQENNFTDREVANSRIITSDVVVRAAGGGESPEAMSIDGNDDSDGKLPHNGDIDPSAAEERCATAEGVQADQVGGAAESEKLCGDQNGVAPTSDPMDIDTVEGRSDSVKLAAPLSDDVDLLSPPNQPSTNTELNPVDLDDDGFIEDHQNEIEVEDEDDYLLYLADILANIHRRFYSCYDTSMKGSGDGEGIMPDMKEVIPAVRRRILRGVRLVFSGVIPTNVPMEKCRAYYLARSMGADIQSHLVVGGATATTHMVAARIGTVKVTEARRVRGLRIVTPTWLWSCAERWERVEEAMFPLTRETSGRESQRLAGMLLRPASSSANTNKTTTTAEAAASVTAEAFPTYDPVTGKRTNVVLRTKCEPRPGTSSEPSQSFAAASTSSLSSSSSSSAPTTSSIATTSFAESIPQMMTLSKEDIAKMDREVSDDLLEDSDDSEDDDEKKEEADQEEIHELGTQPVKFRRSNSRGSVSSTSSHESLSGDNPRGWRRKATAVKRRLPATCGNGSSGGCGSPPKYPRGELPEDSDRSVTSGDSTDGESVGSVDEEMAAAVEREFLRM